MRSVVSIVVCTVASWHLAIAAAASAASESEALHRHHRRHHHRGASFLHTAAVAPPAPRPLHQPHGHRHRHRHRGTTLLHTAVSAVKAGGVVAKHDAAVSAVKTVDVAAKHDPAALAVKSVDVSASVHSVWTHLFSRRPIITGCLKECGYKDQTCVTQCQVCIEQNECRILGQCDSCLEAAHALKLQSAKQQKGTLDAGGVSLRRDGLLAEMTRNRMEAVDRLRELRTARQGVLTAQREAEWSHEERRMSATRLNTAREGLKKSRKDVTAWKLENEKKMQAMRAKARRQRQEKQKAEAKLAAAKDKYSKAQRRLQIASTTNTSEIESGDTNVTEDADEVWKAQGEVAETQQAVEQAEKDVERTSKEGEWLDRGLRERVKGAQTGAAKSREELLESRARERVSQGRLEDAKTNYLLKKKTSQAADEAATESEEKLRKAPLSAAPANATDNKTVKDASLRSSSPHLSLKIVSLQLLFLVGMSMAHGL